MRNKVKLLILAVVSVILVSIFMFTEMGNFPAYVLPKRGIKILAIILTGGSIAFSTVIFQTITNNKILTPSIIGLDSLYMLIQTFLIFVFGATSATVMNKNLNFLLCVALMVVFAGLLYKFLFKKEGRNIYFLLLVGLVMGTLFQSFSSFMQVIIDPNDFMVVQDRMFASFNNINTDLLTISFVLVILIGLYFIRFIKFLDVLSLGREEAINLGVDYDYVVKRLLIVVAILISISTALIGPITFLGLLVANVSYQFLKTYKHSYLITGSILISIIALVGGLLIVERVFTFSTTLSVIINFIGGVYFIYLLLKESRA
ncbi:iron chelate uptake ABC transporter family permease subunit [Heyndrickxia oleronia]|jgi:iron complex transport system permease protein|uniref:Iron ABC transporter permease n=1 Tax=Heyndrickxia oleronia TaxID=38875 RepID=A0A8E2I650_9BACI|nr:iron chelate uptake ABC transporter family permease subunit [Heyndrickxia oleronia]NYV68774.1 iron chelate uptake ABC transporter family permease subunit [Bacillus sp. Gen3]OJH18521.1 iron ABC transporter permease [Bacillus obstructivus]MBU5211327.1 iron chelate uptake ABC transporter family permease subunit [Heyndrickxia oleronia]MCI1590781.1 iron chelate uptake ABC transporter family permease subunit [Heyndrickxia oleronia]MCI1612862.1 iron chelate uptake ABC transporter family permease s